MVIAAPSIEDRLAIREKPSGLPVMHQTWGKLLFMHWPVPVQAIRDKIPARLEIDTFEDHAWMAVTPFTMWNVRATAVPPVPGLQSFHECNVRTYVHYEGVPGVWFFSLDVNKLIPAIAARLLYALNYLKAEIEIAQKDQSIRYSLRRNPQLDAAGAELDVAWTIEESLPEAVPGSLEFFLTERYCLYAATSSSLLRARIWHPPWTLRAARVEAIDSTMLASHGIPEPSDLPLAHYSEQLDVNIWLPEML